MKSYNNKILTIFILVLCIVCVGFVGAVSAGGLTITPTSSTIYKDESVTFSISPYDDTNYTYVAEINSGKPTISSGTFTYTFTTVGDYTVTVTATNRNTSITDDTKTGTAEVTVNEKVTYTPTISSFNATPTSGTAPLEVNFTFTCTDADNVRLMSKDSTKSLEEKNTPISSITHSFTQAGEYKIFLRATNTTSSTPIDSDVITITVNPMVTTITVLDLNIKEPTLGGTPATSSQITATGVTCTGVEWSSDKDFVQVLGSSAKFAADTVYYARVILTNASNYEFENTVPTIKVNGVTLDADEYSAAFSNGDLRVDLKCFDKTDAETSAVSATVTTPVAGDTPDAKAKSGNEDSYVVTKTEWYKSGATAAMNSTDKFEAETAYTVKITLASADSNIFDSELNASDAKINGNTVSNLTHNSDKTITLVYTFAKTGKLEGPSITFSINPAGPKIYIPSNTDSVSITYTYTITGNPTSAILFFGEGTPINLGNPTDGKISGSKTYEFDSIGTFTAYVRAENSNDATTNSIDFSVSQQGLAAILEVGPLTGTAPLTVTCNDKSSGTVSSRTWNFGDGSVASHESSASHTYEKPGTYTITLTVSDGKNTDSATKVITVTEAQTQDTTTTEEKKNSTANYEPFFTIGDVEVPSPVDLIAEFVRLFQNMFNFDNYYIFSNETTEE